MKRIVFLNIASAVMLLLVACSSQKLDDDILNAHDIGEEQINVVTMSEVYRSFKEALLASTDVVVAQYVEHRSFGKNLTEFEFAVIDRVLGNAANNIFIYAANEEVPAIGSERAISYNQGDLAFDNKTIYLLPLNRLQGATLKTHEDGYLFIHNLVMNLDDPALSTMYNEPLSKLSMELDFTSRSLTDEQIMTYVSKIVANNSLAREHIRSEKIEDIIVDSPYIFIVEINDPRRLVSDQVTRDWMETDIYFCTILKTLKGDINVGTEHAVIFFADTVKKGEQHIIAVEQISTTFELSSKNSLFRMDQLDEIMAIIG
ncbi:MAG: hypothetical protein FWD44_09725 [Oscillospiraceae bacterium]|nr:hypothetical protein [Oscillospiraceae bacterium]